MQLFPFQIEASSKIAERFRDYSQDPLMVNLRRKVPFYQNLHSITGSGKTVILADSIAQMRTFLPAEPIVLWLSRGKVVVWQTYNNLSSGKYADIAAGFTVKPLLDCSQIDIESSSQGLILVTTVAKFNQKDKEGSARKIFQMSLDVSNLSLWEMLKERKNSEGRRRPFIVVYDEGHNLTDQQTHLILDLEPDALIAASATMRVPDALSGTISRLKSDKGWSEPDSFVTAVKSSDVVQSGLVKQHILLGGYVTPMEVAVDELLESWKRVDNEASRLRLPLKPKAIYVSNTNVVSGIQDNVKTPFEQRQARPILIWRHLVENHEINAEEIAVYCNLKFDPHYPAPKNLNLFAGKDSDYDRFLEGNFRHIIFNQTLQEGWDDPACYFAYIDKDMGSKDQITQVIGRVLRQPLATHFQGSSLNTAHFYIRTDEKKVFEIVLEDVKQKIASDSPEITLSFYKGDKGSSKKLNHDPKKVKQLPEISIDASKATQPIMGVVEGIHDYRTDTVNTVGKGGRIQILQTIGNASNNHDEWVEVNHSNSVTARWVFVREIQKTYSRAVNLCDIENPKFDAMVEYNSIAANHIREKAHELVRVYLNHSEIIQNPMNPFNVPSVSVLPEKMLSFSNALHAGYTVLNNLEKDFAIELDKSKRVWFKNESRGLFEIPLLNDGGGKTFNPDFVVWVGDTHIIAIDTKGDHLIVEDSSRKLFDIGKPKNMNGPEILIRLVTQGEWSDSVQKIGHDGFTVWTIKHGKLHPLHCETIAETVKQSLLV